MRASSRGASASLAASARDDALHAHEARALDEHRRRRRRRRRARRSAPRRRRTRARRRTAPSCSRSPRPPPRATRCRARARRRRPRGGTPAPGRRPRPCRRGRASAAPAARRARRSRRAPNRGWRCRCRRPACIGVRRARAPGLRAAAHGAKPSRPRTIASSGSRRRAPRRSRRARCVTLCAPATASEGRAHRPASASSPASRSPVPARRCRRRRPARRARSRRHAPRAGDLAPDRRVRVVGGEDGDAVGGERARSRAPFSRATASTLRHELEVLALRVVDQRDRRRGDRRQARDLAGDGSCRARRPRRGAPRRRRSSVSGTPMSLLKLPSVARTPRRRRQARKIDAIICVTVVLPLLPVDGDERHREAAPPAAASSPSARGVSVDDEPAAGRRSSRPRSASAATAPRGLRPGRGTRARRSARRAARRRDRPARRCGVSLWTRANDVVAPPTSARRQHARRVAERRHRRPRRRRRSRRGSAPASAPARGGVGEREASRRRCPGSPRGPCRRAGRRRPAPPQPTAWRIASARFSITSTSSWPIAPARICARIGRATRCAGCRW